MVAKSEAVLVLKPVQQDSTLYRLNKRTTLQFRLDHSLYGQRVELFCNYPVEGRQARQAKAKHYDRNEYHKVPLEKGIYLEEAGSYRLYFTNGQDDVQIGSAYIIVEPSLPINLDSIQCQTVLSKLLGPFSTWPNKLLVSHKSGFNMIHFTPIQTLGPSNSCYSLRDQLTLDPSFGEHVTFEQVRKLLAQARREWGVLSIGDVVLNHTANESEWLMEHSDASYNCVNCPYLRPAYLLDAALARLSGKLARGVCSVNVSPRTEEDLGAIRYLIETEVVGQLRLEEMYMCDVAKCVDEFRERARHSVPGQGDKAGGLELVQDKEFRRFGCTVDMELALKIYNVYRKDCYDEESRLRSSITFFKGHLDALNERACAKLRSSLHIAVNNCIAHIRYQRVDTSGLRLGPVTVKQPLLDRYFTPPKGLDEDEVAWDVLEQAAYGDSTIMAHNGWVLSGNAETNFAVYPAPVYLDRSLIPWSDSVKLNYGFAPSDSPFLWQHMRTYVQQMALLFDGVRLDNCHSTPLHVAEAMVDAAREVNEDLYVLAELFTNDPNSDNVFVNRLGITSLVREAMSAWDCRELGRLLHRYGGAPIGSFSPTNAHIMPSIARALLLDQSHDNESVMRKRSAYDSVTNCALVSMAGCAMGSTRGYDELVPHQISVVTEEREYADWGESAVNDDTGIVAARREFNDLHVFLGQNNFNEIYVDQVDDDVIAITRHNPDSQESVLLVAYTAFGKKLASGERDTSLRIDGVVRRVRLECQWSSLDNADCDTFVKDPKRINGLTKMKTLLRTDVATEHSDMVSVEPLNSDNQQQLHLHLTPGSVIVVDINPSPSTVEALAVIRTALNKSNRDQLGVANLSMLDLNVLLYRCEEEERDSTAGERGAYDVPEYGKLVYCGLQGFISVLAEMNACNDVGHPLCTSLREGPWMPTYIHQRLLPYTAQPQHSALIPLTHWLRDVMTAVNALPRYLRPTLFDQLINYVYSEVLRRHNMQGMFAREDCLRDVLCRVAVQMTGVVPSAKLPILDNGGTTQGSLCAGLPHFTTGYCRNWGRDTFISLRGLYILTGRHSDSRAHILAYAACLRHGLIPNLLDGGTKPRYNCRDATWWWLYCIRCYVLEVDCGGDGISILGEEVKRLFGENAGEIQRLEDVMQEAIAVHFQGLVFREYQAGPSIDAHMTDAGFTVQIGVHPVTGFVFGGNVHNCGTWMDKMGHDGRPATPRDGSAIELVGLQYAVVKWLVDQHADGKYPHAGVTRSALIRWTWREWADKIKDNFEACFWVGEDAQEQMVNKKNIYKDTYGSAQHYPDYQLRCNFPIAMVVSPDLFTPTRAASALRTAQQHLLTPTSLGMRTLDPSDYNYRPDYDNTDDTHGFNYHNGPEWLWPVGYYLRAQLIFGGDTDIVAEHLARLNAHVQTDAWRGLPELTNGGGAFCRDSCRTQAWSAATILETIYALEMGDDDGTC